MQLFDVVEERAVVGKAYAEPAVEHAKPLRLEGREAEQKVVEMLGTVDLDEGLGLKLAVLITEFGELTLLLNCVAGGILPACGTQGCQ